MTLPLRLIILHLSHMGFTDGLTFILLPPIEQCALFTSPCDSASSQIVGRHLNGHLVAGQNLDKVHPELAGNMRQNGVSIADIDTEHGIRQCIGYDALELDYVIFCQDYEPPWS